MKGKGPKEAAAVIKEAEGLVTILSKGNAFKTTPLAPQVGAHQDTNVLITAVAVKETKSMKTGIKIEQDDHGQRKYIKLSSTAADSLFRNTCLKVGDIIVAINNIYTAEKTLQEAKDVIKDAKDYVTILAWQAPEQMTTQVQPSYERMLEDQPKKIAPVPAPADATKEETTQDIEMGVGSPKNEAEEEVVTTEDKMSHAIEMDSVHVDKPVHNNNDDTETSTVSEEQK